VCIRELEELITEYEDAFATRGSDYGRADKVYHNIDAGEARLIPQPSWRPPLAKRAEMGTMFEDIQLRRVIEESNSVWSSLVVLVRKENGGRKLNELIRKDRFPLPRIENTLDKLAGAKWFSTVVLKSSYWQVALHADGKEKTAFSTGQSCASSRACPFPSITLKRRLNG
jgi:hypothetical protein